MPPTTDATQVVANRVQDQPQAHQIDLDAPIPPPPPETATVEELTVYVRDQFGNAQNCLSFAHEVGRRVALHTYHAGYALNLIREALKGKKWSAWQEQQGYSRMTVHRAIQLYDAYAPKAKNAAALTAALKTLTINEAMRLAEAENPKAKKKAKKRKTAPVLTASKLISRILDTLKSVEEDVQGIEADAGSAKPEDLETIRRQLDLLDDSLLKIVTRLNKAKAA